MNDQTRVLEAEAAELYSKNRVIVLSCDTKDGEIKANTKRLHLAFTVTEHTLSQMLSQK